MQGVFGGGLCACCAFPTTLAPGFSRRLACVEAPPASPVLTARAAPLAGARRWVLRGGTVVDPKDGRLAAGVDVHIHGDRIVAVGAADHPGAETLDIAGKFVAPGYNDMHSHVLELEDPSGALALMLAEGVTGFRQMSGSPERLRERREGRLPLEGPAPAALELPGTIFTPLNAGSPAEAAAEVRRQKSEGADFIKIGMVSPEALAAVLQTGRELGISVLGHLQEGMDAREAIAAGFRTVEHLGPGTTLWQACSSIEDELSQGAQPVRLKAPPAGIPFLRGFIMRLFQTVLVNPSAFAPPDFALRLERAIETFDEARFAALAESFAQHDVWHVPTLVRLRSMQLADRPEYAASEFLGYMSPRQVRTWRKVTRRFARLPAAARAAYAQAYPHQQALARKLADAGVRLMAGTDGGWLSAPGLTLREEFAELAAAGFSPLEILRMATVNPADYLRRADEMGQVAPGHGADLVILEANPLERVENLHAIAGVVRAGAHYSKEQLQGLRRRVADRRGVL